MKYILLSKIYNENNNNKFFKNFSLKNIFKNYKLLLFIYKIFYRIIFT